VLVGNVGTAAAGLTVQYAGSAPGAAGTITLALGTGALVERVLDSYVQVATGSITRRESSLHDRSDSLGARASNMEARLEQRRAALMRKFVAMESSIARLQTQAKSLSGLNKFGDGNS
jgi:flagellar capping protein FliD